MKENFFLKHRLLLFILFLFFIFYIVAQYMSGIGLFFDIPAMFLGMINNASDSASNFIVFNDARVRMGNNFLVAIPFNFWWYLFDNSDIYDAIRVFASSYLFVHAFALIVNYLVALRTKRYDIAAVAFAFYFLLSVPNYIWIVRELHITILFYFAILSYFLSKTKLNSMDLIPIFLIIAYLFESFEITVFLGLIFFVATRKYAKRPVKDENIWYKIAIGFSLGLTCFYIPVRMLLIMSKGDLSFSQGITEWSMAIFNTFKYIVNTNSLIICLSLFIVLVAIFYKNKLTVKVASIFFSFLLFSLFVIYKITGFYPNPHIDLLNYTWALLLIFPLILFFIITDYMDIDMAKFNKYFFENLVIIACVFGVINLSCQIYSAYNHAKYVSYLENLLDKSKETIVYIPKEDIKKHKFLKFETCYGSMHKALFLSDDYVVDRIIAPTKAYPDYSKYCMEFSPYTHYSKEQNKLYVQTAPVNIKTKYWDVSPLVGEIQKYLSKEMKNRKMKNLKLKN